MGMQINPANVLSISRVILGLITAAILLGSNADKRFLIAMTLIVLAVITDSIDGRIARRFGFESEVGKLSDRYADHIFANIVWVAIAALGFVSFWVPIIMISRDTIFYWLRDAKAVSSSQRISKIEWLSSSEFMRAAYLALKLAAWIGILITAYFSWEFSMQPIVWVVVVVGILRAVPVITESWRNILFILKENE